MNRVLAKELAPIIKAYGDGEIIQYSAAWIADDGWTDMPTDEDVCKQFPRNDYLYRIKPKPREFWIATCADDKNRRHVVDPLSHSKGPDGNYRCFQDSDSWIKVREVLDEDL